MLNYLKGEIYRLLHKKSMYLYFIILAMGYGLLAYIRSSGFGEDSVVSDAVSFFFYIPILAGGFLFSAIYTDDLSSKNLITLVGFGLGKGTIVISKLILMTLFTAGIFALAPIWHMAVYSLLGCTAGGSQWLSVYLVSLKFALMTIGFSALCGIVVYGLQRTTFAFVSYVLLAFGIVGGLAATAFNTFAPFLTGFLMSGITDGIITAVMSRGSLFLPFAEYVVYIVFAAALSTLAFTKKEMEF